MVQRPIIDFNSKRHFNGGETSIRKSRNPGENRFNQNCLFYKIWLNRLNPENDEPCLYGKAARQDLLVYVLGIDYKTACTFIESHFHPHTLACIWILPPHSHYLVPNRDKLSKSRYAKLVGIYPRRLKAVISGISGFYKVLN